MNHKNDFDFIGHQATSIGETLVQNTIPPFFVPITASDFPDMSTFSKRTKTSMKIKTIDLILDHFSIVIARVY